MHTGVTEFSHTVEEWSGQTGDVLDAPVISPVEWSENYPPPY